jgi:polysaccharide export outer membrane protein
LRRIYQTPLKTNAYYMRKKIGGSSFFILFFLLALLTMSSCSINKNITYFQDIDSLKSGEIASAKFKEPIIENDDIISIVIQTIDPQNSNVVNQVSSTPSVGASSATPIGTQQVSGFLVDKDGYVEIPLIGKIKISGLTTSEARDLVRQKASVYYKEPSVQVRFANFKVTLIGEVTKPATYLMPNEKVTILDALGLAGDLTIYGKRENVLLVRDEGGEKKYARFNLNSTDIFKSPYFYLRQNDVIYVQPNKAKITSTDATQTRNITIAASVLSAFFVVLLRVL